ncbi:MAG: hypothetical protein ACREJ2_06435 [Planctomycetota bacterium]
MSARTANAASATPASAAKPASAPAQAVATASVSGAVGVGVTPRAFARRLRRRIDAWQAASRHCGRQATELWQLRLPLATMLGLTLIGLYDFRAITPPVGSASACEPAAAWCEPAAPASLPASTENSAATASTDFVPAQHAGARTADRAPRAVSRAGGASVGPVYRGYRGVARVAGATVAAPAGAAGVTQRGFELTCRMVAADRSALAPPRT